MLKRRPAHGFTMIELMMTMTLFGILLLMGIPMLSGTIANSKARSVAESIQNGLRTAQTEALRRSRQTVFVLTTSAPAANAGAVANGTNWYIQVLPIVSTETVDTPVVDSGSFGNLASGVTITGPAIICFNSMGRLVANSTTTAAFGAACTVPTGPVTYDVTKSGANRTYELQVNLGGQVRMCDKSKTLSTTNPDGC